MRKNLHKRRRWTAEEEDLLIRLYPNTQASEIAQMINRGVGAVYTRARQMGLRISKERRSAMGRILSGHPNSQATRYLEGHTPLNKGKKVSAQIYEKMRATMFKKGHIPENWKPVGSERVNRDGYIEVKVEEPNKWRLKHRIVWEQLNGPIPKGYNVQFRNGNRQDLSIENLYIINRADQIRVENSIHVRFPEDLRRIVRMKARVKMAIKRKLKE